MNPDHNLSPQQIIEKLVLSTLSEQKKTRRWSVFFKSLTFTYLFAIMGLTAYTNMDHIKGGNVDHTAVITLNGVIAENERANAEDIITSLQSAVKNDHVKGIIIQANSPGGSPVQSAYVFDEIRRIKKENPSLPIYAVVGDLCASGRCNGLIKPDTSKGRL